VKTPSKHLWLGNIPTRPDRLAIEDVFRTYGNVTSVRVFPGKTFAFVNYERVEDAYFAMCALDGAPNDRITGQSVPC